MVPKVYALSHSYIKSFGDGLFFFNFNAQTVLRGSLNTYINCPVYSMFSGQGYSIKDLYTNVAPKICYGNEQNYDND